MSKLVVVAVAGALVGGACSAIGQVQIGAQSTVTRDVFMKVGRTYFLGRLPRVGEPVEMVYTGKDTDGELILMLRVRP